MQQRRATASGRPSGTDGSDFSYRMVVDSRYTKVAKGKTRLQLLIVIQAISQVVGAFLAFVSASNIKEIDSFAILSTTLGFASLIIGELGRQRSLATLLRLYTTTSSMATALSVANIVRRDFFFGAIQNWNISSMKTLEMFEASRVLFGVLLQTVVIFTSTSLVQNMSPKRA